MISTQQPDDSIGPLVMAPQRTLEETSSALADHTLRCKFYDNLRRRRDFVEPIINAFETRRELAPSTVEGPLNGLPVSVKDQVAVAGWPRSFGSETLAKSPEKTNASFVGRLIELGGVVTGKTALPPYAMDFQTGNARRGPTCNPHNPSFTAGGSTGGGAAAVASGMSPLDIGADLSGSLRIPAAWCGVCSYTPTEGYWPNDGLLKGSQALSHFARIGLTASTVQDLNFVWKALESNPNAPVVSERQRRIAIWSPESHPPCDHETFKVWQNMTGKLMLSAFDTAGHPMNDLLHPTMYRLGGEIIGYMTSALIPAVILWFMRRDRQAAQASPGFIAHVHAGYKRDKRRHLENLDELSKVRAQAEHAWSDYDALLLPVTAVCAFEHIAPTIDRNGIRSYDAVFETGARAMGYFDAMTRFTLPLSVLGWPVVTLPIGQDANGLPVGAQLIGKPGADGRLLELALKVQATLV